MYDFLRLINNGLLRIKFRVRKSSEEVEGILRNHKETCENYRSYCIDPPTPQVVMRRETNLSDLVDAEDDVSIDVSPEQEDAIIKKKTPNRVLTFATLELHSESGSNPGGMVSPLSANGHVYSGRSPYQPAKSQSSPVRGMTRESSGFVDDMQSTPEGASEEGNLPTPPTETHAVSGAFQADGQEHYLNKQTSIPDSLARFRAPAEGLGLSPVPESPQGHEELARHLRSMSRECNEGTASAVDSRDEETNPCHESDENDESKMKPEPERSYDLDAEQRLGGELYPEGSQVAEENPVAESSHEPNKMDKMEEKQYLEGQHNPDGKYGDLLDPSLGEAKPSSLETRTAEQCGWHHPEQDDAAKGASNSGDDKVERPRPLRKRARMMAWLLRVSRRGRALKD